MKVVVKPSLKKDATSETSDRLGLVGRLKRTFFGLVHSMLKFKYYSVPEFVLTSVICCLQILYFPLYPPASLRHSEPA
ncbi:MAG: hypothetical protein P4M11_15145 [Candidatus Pacebacteria bacterium]|nr:hypothetical protein [Candidatus Paceibacterota bacterium]